LKKSKMGIGQWNKDRTDYIIGSKYYIFFKILTYWSACT
jgi:hypothetical protein